MAKYRLIEYRFDYRFGDVDTIDFPVLTLARPSIYLGVRMFVGSPAVYPSPSKDNGVTISSYMAAVRLVTVGNSTNTTYMSNWDIRDVVVSDNVDSTKLLITGNVTLFKNDLEAVAHINWSTTVVMYFLEKI